MIVDVIKASGGIADSATGFHLPIKGSSRELFIAFEHHVFEEMGHAVFLVLLNRTAGTAPELKTGHG